MSYAAGMTLGEMVNRSRGFMISRMIAISLSATIFTVSLLLIPLAEGGEVSSPVSNLQTDGKVIAGSASDALLRSKDLISKGRNAEALTVLAPYISDPLKYPAAVADYISILVWEGRLDEAISIYEGLPERFPAPAYMLRNAAKAYYDKKEYLKAATLYKEAFVREPEDKEVQKGIVLSLMQLGELEEFLPYLNKFSINPNDLHSYVWDFEKLAGVIGKLEADAGKYPDYLLSWIAWSFFKTQNIAKAMNYYQLILDRNPDYIHARIGLAYCLASEKQTGRAFEILDKLLVSAPRDMEVMFARAYAFERSGDFVSAVKEYTRILEIAPENKTARKLRIRALTDLGASSYALEEALKYLPEDSELRADIEGDMAVDRIKWKEYEAATIMLQPRLNNEEALRTRYDYIIARIQSDDVAEAVRLYEQLEQEGALIPPWLKENIASVYLYLEQPYMALKLYEDALQAQPTHSRRMGKFYVLQELRQWKDAKDTLAALDADTPVALRAGKKLAPNWDKMTIALAKGWLLLYEDRLQEAEDYFWDLHEKAPENTNIRSGLAHTYMWRGWPRKALEEFRIIENLDPKDKSAQIGKIHPLNKLAYREDARASADKLLALRPRDKHVQAIVRQLKLEEMRKLEADFAMRGDDDGFEEVTGTVTFRQPVSLHTELYGFVLWSRASEKDDRNTLSRAGVGVEHILNSYLKLRQLFSINYDDGKNVGSYSEIYYTPDDYWEIALAYDSYSTDVPLRARIFDIETDKLSLDIAYVESDWRTYSLLLLRQRFSDTNERYQGVLGYEQGLWVKNNWRERVFVDFTLSENSLEDAQYFNPDNDYGFSVTHMTEHTVKRIYQEAFLHRLYLSAGVYKQDGISVQPVGSVRYEHDISFSDTHALLYGAGVGSQAYDGEAVTTYNIYLKGRLLF